MRLFGLLPQRDLVACNVAISCCEKGSRWLQALELLGALPKPDVATWPFENDSRYGEFGRALKDFVWISWWFEAFLMEFKAFPMEFSIV